MYLPASDVGWILFGVYLLWVVFAGASLVLARRSPVATLAWIVALLFLPYVGVLVYVFFGPRRLVRKKRLYHAARRRIDEATGRYEPVRRDGRALPEDIRVRYRQLAHLAERLEQLPPARAESVAFYNAGESAYAAMEEAISGARHHLHLEYYIWDPGPVGDRFRDLLVERARAGVAVKLIVDDVGSPKAGARYFAPLVEAGGEVAWFNPVRLTRFKPTLLNFRTHRKIVIVDGRIGFLGGMNISDRQTSRRRGGSIGSATFASMGSGDAANPDDAGWRDTHMRFTGPPVAALQRVFLEDWHFAAEACPVPPEFFPTWSDAAEGPAIQIIASGPDDDHFAIQRFVFAAVATARQTIRLTTPYFIPDEPLLEALKAAALRGVDVALLVPAKSDSRLVSAAAQSYFDELSAAGVSIHEYGPAMLHAKTFVVDDTIAAVGTANLDVRSFRLNFEVMAAIYDPATARGLAETFADDLRSAAKYVPGTRRSLANRLACGGARLLSPVL